MEIDQRIGESDVIEDDTTLSNKNNSEANALVTIAEIGLAWPHRERWAALAATSLIGGHITPEQAIAAAAGK